MEVCEELQLENVRNRRNNHNFQMQRLPVTADAAACTTANDCDHGVSTTDVVDCGGALSSSQHLNAKYKMEKLPPPTDNYNVGGGEEQQVNVISSGDEAGDDDAAYYDDALHSLATGSDFAGFPSLISSARHTSHSQHSDGDDKTNECGGRGDGDTRPGKSAELKKRASAISLRDTNVGGDDYNAEVLRRDPKDEKDDDASSYSSSPEPLFSIVAEAANLLRNFLKDNPRIKEATGEIITPSSAPDQIVEINSNSTTKTQREKRLLRNNKVQLYLNQQQLQQQQQTTIITTPNTQHKCSTESTSEFPVSSPSNPHPGGSKYPQRTPLLKNTLPADSFERHLALIAARNPQMTLEDKMRVWHCDEELSDVEDVNNFDDLFKKREESKRKTTGKNRRGTATTTASALSQEAAAKNSTNAAITDALPFSYDFTQFRAMMLKNFNSPQVVRKENNTSAVSGSSLTSATATGGGGDKDKPSTSAAAHLAAQRRLKAAAEVETATRKRAQKAEKNTIAAKKTQQHSTTPPATSSSDENDVECYPPGPKKKLKALPLVDAKKATPSSSQKILVYEKVLCPSSSEETSQEAMAATAATPAKSTKASQPPRAVKDAKETVSLLPPQLHWANTTDEDSVFRLHRLNRDIDKSDDQEASPDGDRGGGLIQMRLDFLGEKKNFHLAKEKRNELFKTPTVPQKYLLTNFKQQQSDTSYCHDNGATVASASLSSPTPDPSQELVEQARPSTSPEGAAFHRQHEFCNYLGLTGMSTANAVANALAELDKCNLARRSLRVRQLQHQERSEKKEKKERKVRKEKKEKTSIIAAVNEDEEEDDGKELEALKAKQLRELKRREKSGGTEILALVVETTGKDIYETESTPRTSRRRHASQPSTTTAEAAAVVVATSPSSTTAQQNGRISVRPPPSPTPPPISSITSPLALETQQSPLLHAAETQQQKEPEIKILCHIAAKNKAEAEKASKKAVKQITAPIRQSLMRHLKRGGSAALGVATTCSSSNGASSTSPRSSPSDDDADDGEEAATLDLPTAKRQAVESVANTPTTTNTRSSRQTQRNKRDAAAAIVEIGSQSLSPPAPSPHSGGHFLLHRTPPAVKAATVSPNARPLLLNQFQEYLKESRQTKPSIYIVQSLTSGETMAKLNASANNTNAIMEPAAKPATTMPPKNFKPKVAPKISVRNLKKRNVRKRLSNGTIARGGARKRLHKLLTRSALNLSQQRQLRSRRIVMLKTLQRATPKATPPTTSPKTKTEKATSPLVPVSKAATFRVRENMRSSTPAQREPSTRKQRKKTEATDAPPPQLEKQETTRNCRQSPQVRRNHNGQSHREKQIPTTDEIDLTTKETTRIKPNAAKAHQQNANDPPDAVVVSSTTNSYDDTALLNITNCALLLLPTNTTKELHKNLSYIVDSGSSGGQIGAASRSTETKDSATQSLNISAGGGGAGGVCTGGGIHYLANTPSAASSLQNPLKSDNGRVLYIYYEMDLLIVVQEALVSFWKYSKLINVLAAQQQKSHAAATALRLSEPSSSDPAAGEWVHLGECRHIVTDVEISSPYTNRICIHNSIPIYVEMRCRVLPQERRECNLLSMYINVYYYHDDDLHAKMHSIQLDSVQSVPSSVIFTTITESRYFVMSWPQENIMGKLRSGLCKYSLTPHLDTLASIREFKSMRHEIRYLECTDDDKLLGFGATQLTIWDHRSGDVLMNYDLDLTLGRNMGSIYYPSLEIGQQNAILLFQYIESVDVSHEPELIVIACSISHVAPTHRVLQRHRLPAPAFNAIVSTINTGEHLLLTAQSDEEIWISCVDPNMITCVPAQHTQRFYARGRTQLIELTPKSLTVDSFANHVLKLAAGTLSK